MPPNLPPRAPLPPSFAPQNLHNLAKVCGCLRS
nr:MAG TPA: hypothetical protein [Caudoviricetes sp.]